MASWFEQYCEKKGGGVLAPKVDPAELNPKDCPFCCGSPILKVGSQHAMIYCEDCGAEMAGVNEWEVKGKWNQRVWELELDYAL